jgi:large subunit ribosomal protein L17
MRHRCVSRRLSRPSDQKKALLRSLAISLLEKKCIKTTLPKAKELRRFLEPLITLGKQQTVHAIRLVFARLGNRRILPTLLACSKNCFDRPGGYVRILRCGHRIDGSVIAMVELLDQTMVAT